MAGCCNKAVENKKQGKVVYNNTLLVNARQYKPEIIERSSTSVQSKIIDEIKFEKRKSREFEINIKKRLPTLSENSSFVKIICKPVECSAIYVHGDRSQESGWIVKSPVQGIVFIPEDQFSKLFEIVEEEEGE